MYFYKYLCKINVFYLQSHEITVALFYLFQNSNEEVTKEKGAVSLAYYLFRNVQVVSTCEVKDKVISDVEQFKTDGINLIIIL